ncbi:MAG: hypothetical protein HY245_02960 [Rhizobiales bacterium]|nr:hypothetical protein [Hyphomicrobiales bacterium]
MKKLFMIAFSTLTVTVFAGPALAGGELSPGKNKDALESFYSGTGSPTPSGSVANLGGAISGGFYGNTSNAGISPYAPDNGHGVTPSISPGPQIVGGGGPGTGTSLGEAIQAVHSLY